MVAVTEERPQEIPVDPAILVTPDEVSRDIPATAVPVSAKAETPTRTFDDLFPGMYEAGQGLAEIKRREAATNAQLTSDIERQIASDRRLAQKHFDAAGVEASRLQPWNAEQEWDRIRTAPFEAFGSFASVFGIIASAFTRAPMENALNASAAAMTSIHKGDMESYERNFASWKTNMELVQKRFQMQNTLYND